MKLLPTPAPNTGEMMDKHMRQHRYHKAALARKIAVNYTTVVNFMRSPDNRVSYIWNICHALRYNFLSDLAAQLPPDMPCAPTPKRPAHSPTRAAGAAAYPRVRHPATRYRDPTTEIRGYYKQFSLLIFSFPQNVLPIPTTHRHCQGSGCRAAGRLR